ncbi:MAG TPA: 1-acyl-sn-glycerol-3-phosphate acyltransferase [Rectinemataceae bacterium]|nr:1-acyl-sn-glycerol-3-phosphate acyltransferase [Rectinemataceae bacterium]
MNNPPRFVPRNIRWFNRLLRATYGAWLLRFFRIRVINPQAALLRPPYILVSNHVNLLDPFILGSLVREPVYWITSDGNMRSRIMRVLLRLVGSIPKAKAIPDIETVNWTVRVIRERRGVVGVFPEGQQTWDGSTLPLIPSTAKLLKLLKVPVVGTVIRGGFLSLPRWSWARRRGRIDVEFRLLFTPEQLRALSVDELQKQLEGGLQHDECAWEERERVAYQALRKAEHLELALFMCPRCEAIGSLRSARSRFFCTSCGMALSVDIHGAFRGTRGETPPFRNLRDWDRWQHGALAGLVERTRQREAAERPLQQRPLFSDAGALLLRGHKMNPLRAVRSGTLILYSDRIELATLLGERLSFPLSSIEGIGVLKRNLLEFYVGRDLYQVRFPFRHNSGRKWLEAVQLLAGQ